MGVRGVLTGRSVARLCGLAAGEAGLERVDRLDARREPGLFDEHDGEAVADGVGQAADLGDEEVALGAQPAAGERAAEQVEELWVDGVGGSLGGHRLGRSKSRRQYTASASRINATPPGPAPGRLTVIAWSTWSASVRV